MKSKDWSTDNIKLIKEIFQKMRDSLGELKTKMIDNIRKRIEENIAIVRAEYYQIMNLWTLFEKEYLQGVDISTIDHHERREKIEIPKAFKIQDLVEMK